VKVGDLIEFTCNGKGRGGHYHVTAVVTKINRKTVDATEYERSYRPGTLWRMPLTHIEKINREWNQGYAKYG
jgi:hypothetical protein